MASRRAPDFSSLIAALARALTARRLPFMLVGGQAVLVHGQPRLTEDIDITLGADVKELEPVLSICGELGLVPLPKDVRPFVEETFVLPVRDQESAARVDFIFSSTEYERSAIARAVRVDVAGVPVPFAAAEDLIIHKLFAGRARDLEDAMSVVRRKRDRLDWQYIERWARDFASIPGREEMPAQVARLRKETA